jgi:histidinol-phosphate aminotransferase
VLRTFSKIYGLAGLRVGYGVGPRRDRAIGKVRRAFDVDDGGAGRCPASLDDADGSRCRRQGNREAMAALAELLRRHGWDAVGPAVANFFFVEVGEDATALDDALLRQGVIVRPMGSFGAPHALRITAGTLDEIAFLGEALAAIAVPR